MGDGFQRIFERNEPAVMSLNVQAALGAVRQPDRSQVSLLIRHFLERFFNHETASPDGDAKARLVLIAFTAGLPGFVVALYLWPVYHPFRGWPPDHPSNGGPPPYWLQVNHHFFYVLYSFVALGIVTIFEWDMFFPDLLDVFVLHSLPISDIRMFCARVTAITIFIFGFLFDANVFAPLVLPAATDPPNLPRFLAGHLLAVAGSGLVAALLVLALQSILLAALGERIFRRISLALQGIAVTAFLMLLLLFPVLSGVVPAILQSGNHYALWFPPFWFLGIYQRLVDGPAAMPVFSTLARIGCAATLAAAGCVILMYPLAYMRRVRGLVEGAANRSTRSRIAQPFNIVLNATCLRPPSRRAIFHFISQTLLRVPRYRIYLVMYGGVGVSVVIATILRLEAVRGQIHAAVSVDGIRAAIGITAFWTIAGLRTAFVSPGNEKGSWAMWAIHGRPPEFAAAIEELVAAKVWVLLCAVSITFTALFVFRSVAPPELLTTRATAAQVVVAGGMCVLLTDFFFLNVTSVAFTGPSRGAENNLAFTVLRYFTFFPLVSWLSLAAQPWMEASGLRLGMAAAGVVVAHLWLRKRHRAIVRDFTGQIAPEDGEDEFPMRLGLRY